MNGYMYTTMIGDPRVYIHRDGEMIGYVYDNITFWTTAETLRRLKA